MKHLKLHSIVPIALTDKRLDQALAKLYPEHSRSRIQFWINSGDVQVNNKKFKQRDKVKTGDIINIDTIITKHEQDQPESIPLDIIYQDESLIILNKPAGLVTHPGAGNPNHTLVNALLNFDANLAILPRAGLIHRLDKNTSGLMVIARTLAAHTYLVKKLQNRGIKREYQTIVSGQVIAGGSIENKIGRHLSQRTKMAVKTTGKTAITHYRVIAKYQHYTHLLVQLETGRTHQIRVHLTHINHPILGDSVYGKNRFCKKGLKHELLAAVTMLKRQALHACSLTLSHPDSGHIKTFYADLPQDMKQLLAILKRYDKQQ